MLRVEKASDDAQRKKRGPVIVVSHIVDRATIMQVLRAYADDCGVDKAGELVKEALGDLMQPEPEECVAGHYYCYVPSSGRGPKVPHSNLSSAVAEAKRLVAVSQQPTRVLKLIATVAAPTTPEVIWASNTK